MDHLVLYLFLLLCLFLQCPSSFSWKSLTFLDLGSNLLEGPLPSSLCNLGNLQYLLLSNNNLSGPIPHCFGNISSQLTVLDLRNNSFHGMIPKYFPADNKLRNLGLNGNHLEGPIPQSLINCSNLEVLDLGHNKISDAFPMWLQTLRNLSVLILASNNLSGTIGTPTTKSAFVNLRILDISYNHFTGSLPVEMIKRFQAMKKKSGNQTQEQKYMGDGSYYQDSVTLMMKGLEIEIKRVLTIFTTIDLSGNQFEGHIPNSIGDLTSLKVLNFSHNKFNGLIPSTVGYLSELESLDLSWNQLSGKIPQEIAKLTSLSVFNVSENQLEGPIPRGPQLNTFTNFSYRGNPGLCGFPLDDCARPQGSQSPARIHENYSDAMSGLTWESVVLGYGFGMIIGLVIGVLAFYTHKPKWFIHAVEDMCKHSKKSRNEIIRWRQQWSS